jgi:hypothetical protein
MSEIKYLPNGDVPFLNWSNRFIKNLAPLLERLGFPPATYELLVALKNTFSTALETATNSTTRTSGTIAAKNDARKAFEKELRVDVQRYLVHNPDVTNKDREDLGLPVYKTTHTPVPVPTQVPRFNLKVAAGSRVVLNYFSYDDKGEPQKAKPFGVHGAEIAWSILETPPESYADLVRSVFDTQSPYTFQFDLTDAGSRLYVSLRWENNRGEKGPWSPIQSIVIS